MMEAGVGSTSCEGEIDVSWRWPMSPFYVCTVRGYRLLELSLARGGSELSFRCAAGRDALVIEMVIRLSIFGQRRGVV